MWPSEWRLQGPSVWREAAGGGTGEDGVGRMKEARVEKERKN